MIADMMLFARPPQPKLEQVDLGVLVAGLVAELASWAGQQKTQIVLHAPAEPVVVSADKTQLAVAVRSLCINALEALSSGGQIEIVLDRRVEPAKSRAACETVQITVADNGPGIPPAARRHLFDPFYSGREAGRGLGLGLSKCWRIVTLHGGRIEVDSTPGQGARFTISLPIEPQR
jgi:signal transduction histidine kinase